MNSYQKKCVRIIIKEENICVTKRFTQYFVEMKKMRKKKTETKTEDIKVSK